MSNITKRIAELSPERRQLLERLLKQEQVDVSRAVITPRRRDAGPLPLSFAQQRLWFFNQLEPESASYNLPSAIRLTGALDPDALERSLNEIVRRHESLRTTFHTNDGLPHQVIEEARFVRPSFVDLSALPSHVREAEVQRLVEEEVRRPFDLARGPVFRAGLLKLDEREHVLLLVMHHIVSDGWSMGILVRELTTLYAAFKQGVEPRLEELPIQYADFAAWQRDYLAGEVLEEQLRYWREQLGGELPVLELPADRARPPVQSYRGAEELLDVDLRVADGLRALGRENGATLYMVLLAAFDVLLYRYTGQEDIIVGTPLAGRTRADLEGLIGFFVNTLALRAKLNARMSFRELLQQVRRVTLGAYAHQDLPFERLVEELQPERSASHTPLVQVVFALQNAATGELELPEVGVEALDTETETAKFDVRLSVHEMFDGLNLSIRYRTDLFDASRIRRMLAHYRNLLAGIVANPEQRISRLPLMDEDERRDVLTRWDAGKKICAPPSCIHGVFESQAKKRPEAVALVFGGERVTYRELNRRANHVARRLRRSGVGPESRVGICLERGPEMVSALLGVLKAGGAYVPLDPEYPQERLAFMAEDARVEVLITRPEYAGKFESRPVRVVSPDASEQEDAPQDEENFVVEVLPENPAYIIYTSGSTGKPKGVEVTHANVARLFEATESWYGFDEHDVWTLFHSYAFDFSVWEMWGALLYGGRLVIVPYFVSRSPVEFRRLLSDEQVTILNQTPSAFRQLMRADEAAQDDEPLSLRLVIFGGEALELQSLESWFERHGDTPAQLVNMYGITETTVHVTYRRITAADAKGHAGSLIGVPIPDLQVYVLDDEMQPVPIGVPGELYVGGAGPARGYLNHPELTAERFVPHPFGDIHGARLYKTGDLARLIDDGDVEYLGRCDRQVKIRGFRIELGEIEAELLRHSAVGESVVLVREDRPGDKRLVAYVVGASQTPLHVDELQNFLRPKLPEHMIPASFVVLDALPLTPSGKVDRRALPPPGHVRPDITRRYTPPRNALEEMLAEMWQGILGLDAVGVEDDFFGLGGDSIKGAIFINRLQDRLGEVVHVVTIFNEPTIAKLAAYLTEEYAQAVQRMTGAMPATLAAKRGVDEELAVQGVCRDVAAAVAAPRRELRVTQMRELIKPRAQSRELASQAKNSQAVFVLSPPRSGSTLFRVMLAGHPNLFAPPELELLSFHMLKERRAAFSGGDGFWLEGMVRAVMEVKNCDAATAARIMEELEERDLTTKETYRLLQEWLGQRRLVDKTPSYALDCSVLAKAESDFQDALYIHLIRHPFGMIRSFEEARLEQIFFRYEHSFTRRELAELIWLVSHQNIIQFLERVPRERTHQVRFEELLAEPEVVLSRVCRFLNIEFTEAMLRPYQEKERRMTDGLHAESRMLGDVKFHRHAGIESRVADSWRERRGSDDLAPETWEVAAALGYPVEQNIERSEDGPSAKTEPATQRATSQQVTQATQAQTVEDSAKLPRGQAGTTQPSMLIPIQPHGSKEPFFCVHPAGGNSLCYFDLARQLGKGQPFYGLQSPDINAAGELVTDFEQLAGFYVSALQSVRPHGPYLLGGWSLGGIVAFEMAQQLYRRGERVELLALLDSRVPDAADKAIEFDDETLFAMFAGNLGRRFGVTVDDLYGLALDEQLSRLRRRSIEMNAVPATMDARQIHDLFRIFKANIQVLMNYEPQKYPGRITLFRAQERFENTSADLTEGWGALAAEGVKLHVMPGNHYTMISMPHARTLAAQLSVCLEESAAQIKESARGRTQ